MRERTVEAHFVKRVEETGGIVRKVQWIGRRGAPDRWCGWPSTRKAGWVELKKPMTPHAAAHQDREHSRLRSCGEQVNVLATIMDVDTYVSIMTGINVGQIRSL